MTYNAPASGSGSYSYSAALVVIRAAGTPALSGSGLGAYSITGLSDDDVVALDLTVTDTVTLESYVQRVVVTVEEARGYDVSPPAATSEAVASGGSLSAKTFGSFTGTDAGLITTYAHRVVNASGSTTWSDGGTDDTLGPWTASGAADGSAGVLALDAYIGSVVVATALHDYAIASSGGGGGGGGGATPSDPILDFSGVNYDFLTTGGTSGTGGEGPHTVNGYSITLSYNGTSGPTTLAFVNGVLQHRGNVSTRQAYLIVDLGVDVDENTFALGVVANNLGTSSSQSFIHRLATHNTVGAQANTIGFLWGYNGAASDTSILVRRASSPTFYNTIQQLSGLTDITTTATRFQHIIQPTGVTMSYDQGTATLPVDGQNLGTLLTDDDGDGFGAVTRLNRRYLHLFCLEDVDVQTSAYSLSTFGWKTVESTDLTDGNVTPGSTSTPGAFTILASDGVTVRQTGTLISVSGATGTVSWDSTGVRLVNTAGSGVMYVTFDAPLGDIADLEEAWHVDAVIKPLVSPSASYMVVWLGKGNTLSTNTSVAWDLQDNAAKIEARRTVSGPSYSWGLTDTLGGVLPTSSNLRIECRGGRALFIGWDHSATDYFDTEWSGADSFGLAHGEAGVIGSTEMFGGTAYFGMGATAGVDLKLEKWRWQELS